MKITCQACQAKYTIADEKVVGKVVKIRCKKCGATIVVNGNEPGAGSSQAPPEEAPAESASPKAGGGEPWTVNVAEGDQRTMNDAEVVTAYRAGLVTDDTFCWKEGMADWLSIAELPALHTACTTGVMPPVLSREEEDSPTRIHDAVAGASTAHSAPPPAPRPKSLPPSKDGNGAAAAVAARRSGGRVPDNDLFGSASKAGGEDEVMTSLPGADKMTGARNENSVLFALNPLTDKGAPAAPSKMVATSEASGLIDIRQLSAQMRSTPPDDKKKRERVDDIMNLGGGGLGPTLAAPVLAAPSLEHISTPPPPSMLAAMSGSPPPRSKAITFLVVAAGTFLLAAAVALVMMLWRGKTPDDDRGRSSLAAEVTPPTGASGAGAKSAPSGAASQGGSAAPQASSPPPSDSATAPPASAKEPAKDVPASAPVVAAVPKPMNPGMPAPVAAPPVGEPSASFNMGEARARLGAIAGAAQSCKRGDTTGTGRVEIVFAPTGGVQSAVLVGGSPFDGTVTGKCVEARFRGARIPPFGGSPQAVTKSFTIN